MISPSGVCGGSDIIGVMCMPLNSKFLTESTGKKKLVKICQYLLNIGLRLTTIVYFLLDHPV